jgi:hypothetical protein
VGRTFALLGCLIAVFPGVRVLAETPESGVRRAHIPADNPADGRVVEQERSINNPFLDRTAEVFGTPSPQDPPVGETTPSVRQGEPNALPDARGNASVGIHSDATGLDQQARRPWDGPTGAPADSSMQIEIPAYLGAGTSGSDRNTGSRRLVDRSQTFGQGVRERPDADSADRGDGQYVLIDGRLHARRPGAPAHPPQTTPSTASTMPRDPATADKPSFLDRLPRLWPKRKPADVTRTGAGPPHSAAASTRTVATAEQTINSSPQTAAAAPPTDRARHTMEKKPLLERLPKLRAPKWMAFGRTDTEVRR